jgi:polysaccharide biosynthesis protein PslG
LVVALLALLATAGRADAADRRVPAGWLGVTADGPMEASDRAEWGQMASAGVETVRTAFYWALLRPRPADAAGRLATDFTSTDAIVVAAARRGLSVLPVVQWPPPGQPCSRGGVRLPARASG